MRADVKLGDFVGLMFQIYIALVIQVKYKGLIISKDFSFKCDLIVWSKRKAGRP